MGFNSKLCIFFTCGTLLFIHGSPTKKASQPTSISLCRRLVDNFHTVEKNKLYRSRQLSARGLRHYIAPYRIKTIINLRGPNPTQHWWLNEKKEAERMGVHLYHIPMSACALPSKTNLIKLIHLFKTAPRPILIHCKSGADRTGEAAALWVLEQQKKSKKKALKQLSLKYWHFSARRPHKKTFIRLWQGLEWLINEYSP